MKAVKIAKYHHRHFLRNLFTFVGFVLIEAITIILFIIIITIIIIDMVNVVMIINITLFSNLIVLEDHIFATNWFPMM